MSKPREPGRGGADRTARTAARTAARRHGGKADAAFERPARGRPPERAARLAEKRAGAKPLRGPDRGPAAGGKDEVRGGPGRSDKQRPPRPRGHRPEAEPELATGTPSGPMRIAKAMARAGLCSRRDAERWIADGRVRVNGRVIVSPALDVGPDDRVLVDEQPLPGAAPPLLWRYHKPKGLVTTHRDPEGRPTVFEKMPPEIGRVISVGRLDVSSEGLLLMTNDGALARHMELPATGWLRRYRVRAHGRITAAALDKLKEGIEVEGVQYGPIEATLDKEQGANVWLTLGLREGKNREVRKILGALGLDVNRLIRISYGPFQLQDLLPGQVEQVKRRVLMDQLGPQLQRQFGLLDIADADRARRNKARDASRKDGAGGGRRDQPGDEDQDA